MSKKSKKIDDETLSIFDFLSQKKAESSKQEKSAGAFACIDRLRTAMSDAIKSCSLSVYQLAGEMSHRLNETITSDMIYSWTRQSDEVNGRPGRHIPAEYLPAFCDVTGSNKPIEIMGELVGLFILPGPDALRAEIQKYDEEIAKAKRGKQSRMMLLKELEKHNG